MGDLVDLATVRAARSSPNTGTVAKPTRRDQQDLSSKFAEFTPGKLGAILRQTERGVISDWADLCDRMASDATVRASYESRLSAVGASRWIVEPGDPTGDPARDRYAAPASEFVERVYRDIEAVDPPTDYRDVGGFDQAVMNLLDGIGKGLGAVETDWRYVSGDWVPGRLSWVHTRRFRFSPSWEPRLVDTGDALYADGLELEPGKFVIHMPRAIAGYPTMTGAMRTVCWPHLFKKWCQQFWFSGAERFAWPFMWAKVARDAPAEVRAKLLTGMEQLSSDHVAVLEDATAVELLETAVKDGGTWKEFHAAMNSEITKGLQGMSDAAEAGKFGNYGAVEARKGISVDPRIALDERGIAGTVRKHLTYWLLWYNRHRFGGVMPPVPHVRWVIAGKRREIPRDAYSVVTRNQVLESLDLPPVSGADGDALAMGGGVSDTQAGRVVEILQAVEAGTRSPELAALLIRKFAPSITAAEATAFAQAAAAKAPPPAPPAADPAQEPAAELADPTVEAGQTWIDTEDQHRLLVTAVTATSVYFRDLDSEKPERQWRWARASFLERCTPAPEA